VQTIRFLPSRHTVSVPDKTTVLDAALGAGIFIHAQCGGAGTCGRCAVRVVDRAPESAQSLAVLGRKRYAEGWRLACDTEVVGGLSVEIPAGNVTEPSRPHAALRPVHEAERPRAIKGPLDPPVSRHRITLSSPAHGDNVNDLTRIVSRITKETGERHVSVSLGLLWQIPGLLREYGWDVAAYLAHCGHDMGQAHLVRVGRGNTRGPVYAVAFDIGTTSLWAALLDTETGREVGRTSVVNPQAGYGADVISRIVYARTGDGALTLKRVVAEALDGLIDELLRAAKADRSAVTHVVAAGNTVMSHLLLGLPTEHLRKAPYVPAAGVYPDAAARQVGLDLPPEVPLFVFPSVASYVGGDIVAGVLASGLFKEETITLFIDIGTNGEIVLGNSDWMFTASASAGPAFEGGGVRFGMRASAGAVEGFSVNNDYEPMITTIGRKPPVGISGSGIINGLAGLFGVGAVLPNGTIREDLPTPRVRKGENGTEYVLVWPKDAGIDEDIVISEVDIENVVRAKAAVFAGCRSLTDAAGIGPGDVGRVIISGAFGNVLDVENAVRIGLLPDIPRERFVFIGNGSLFGASLAALSRSHFRQGLKIAAGMTNVELSVDPGYMDRYTAACFLPHTDIDLFPTVKGQLADRRDALREGASA